MPPLRIPSVTLEDLQTFQAKHFPGSQQQDHHNKTDAVEDSAPYEDDLGYYPDGVKRTLTDEQIKIFRHSEIHALLREKELREEAEAEDAQARDESPEKIAKVESATKSVVNDEGQSQTEVKETAVKAQKQGGTEDATLDYGEESTTTTSASKRELKYPQYTGRRIISYDD